MTYQVLARKYRPPSFKEVIGQDATVQTLKNALEKERLHQAYLFCGARGVGKTSMARIFAKSLNCEKGPRIDPCLKCSSCEGITKSSSMNVLEIDGASNTGVDDVRELREQAQYLPANAKYKIYIIDEVHMLSQSAFNALLKILEEPPAHLIFIFATTEPHKIPITILSRCQRFDFKKLSQPVLINHLKNILQSEKIKIDDESLHLIAHCAGGSVRDSLSLLDQVISFGGDDLSPDRIREILGLADQALLYDLLEGLLKEDGADILQKAQDIDNKGIDLKIFTEGLLELIRHLLIFHEGGQNLLDLSPGEKDRLSELATSISTDHCLILFQILSRSVDELARSEFPKMIFETTLIKCLKSKNLLSLSQLINQAQKGSLSLGQNSSASSAIAQKTKSTEKKTLESKPQASKKNKNLELPAVSDRNWNSFVSVLLEKKPQLGSLLEHARLIQMENGHIHLALEDNSVYKDMIADRIETIENLATKYFDESIRCQLLSLDQSQKAPASPLEMREEEEKKRLDRIKKEALEDPLVKKAQEIFGAEVLDVKVGD